MKKITILTLFPEMFTGILTNSIVKRAISKNIVEVSIVNIRDFTLDKHHRVDSAPIGGGPGLIMKCQPIIDALNSVKVKSVEVHISNIYEREDFRHISYIKDECIASIVGKGFDGYLEAIDILRK